MIRNCLLVVIGLFGGAACTGAEGEASNASMDGVDNASSGTAPVAAVARKKLKTITIADCEKHVIRLSATLLYRRWYHYDKNIAPSPNIVIETCWPEPQVYGNCDGLWVCDFLAAPYRTGETCSFGPGTWIGGELAVHCGTQEGKLKENGEESYREYNARNPEGPLRTNHLANITRVTIWGE